MAIKRIGILTGGGDIPASAPESRALPTVAARTTSRFLVSRGWEALTHLNIEDNDLRSGDPSFIDKLVALTFGSMAYDAILDGKSGLMSGMVAGLLRFSANSGPQARAAQSGRRHHVQH